MRRLRVAKGLSQESLGLAAGCEPSYIGRLERGRENPTVDLLESITDALKEPVGSLFETSKENAQPQSGLRPGRKPSAPGAKN